MCYSYYCVNGLLYVNGNCEAETCGNCEVTYDLSVGGDFPAIYQQGYCRSVSEEYDNPQYYQIMDCGEIKNGVAGTEAYIQYYEDDPTCSGKVHYRNRMYCSYNDEPHGNCDLADGAHVDDWDFEDDDDNAGAYIGLIIGIVVGVIVLLAIIVALIVCLCCKGACPCNSEKQPANQANPVATTTAAAEVTEIEIAPTAGEKL